jgi:hypothetical protein
MPTTMLCGLPDHHVEVVRLSDGECGIFCPDYNEVGLFNGEDIPVSFIELVSQYCPADFYAELLDELDKVGSGADVHGTEAYDARVRSDVADDGASLFSYIYLSVPDLNVSDIRRITNFAVIDRTVELCDAGIL